ncbi:hypothetical protein RHMOL_Rhmol07G0158600 [Rhododendron molle]|uniref:Uncharacterized protein n=1 Tax=Rhododendron molle TaxID=49168 RepID=A0ACC0N329_RHOML|nr:hypothetical protein RHMOL_Rhmol07G0158600 [Rhododendron molle]
MELTSARALDSQHFLLEGPFSRARYLGERVANQYFPRSEALQLVPLPPPASMRLTHLLIGEGLLLALERRPATDFLRAGDYSAFHLASLILPITATVVPLVWPRAPSCISFHNANGDEEHLTLTPCATQLYVLPSGVQQVILQTFLLASFQRSSDALLHDDFPCSLKRSGCRRYRLLKVLELARVRAPGLVMEMLELMMEVRDRGSASQFLSAFVLRL